MDSDILNPVIPYVGPISSFSPGKLVNLEGVIPPNANGFDINLQCGSKTYPPDDIALQISVRILDGYIGLNSSQQRIWGKEIRLTNVPIGADQTFKISVLCEFNKYKVSINDEHDCIFPQRIRCEKVSYLKIDGDVSITRISLSISDSTTPLASTINQLNHEQHSDLPPSYDTAMNSCEDVESQNEDTVDHIAIVRFRHTTGSPPKTKQKNGCKSFCSFISVITTAILLGYFIFLAKKAHKNKGDTSYGTYGTPSNDFKAVRQDMEKHFKDAQDAIAISKKINEENKHLDEILASAKKTIENNEDYFRLVRNSKIETSNKKVINNNNFYGFVRTTPDRTAQKNKIANDALKKLQKKTFEDLIRTSNQFQKMNEKFNLATN